MQQIRRVYMVLVLNAFFVSILFAQSKFDDERRESLRGLAGVLVIIEDPGKGLRNAGITTKILEMDVEVKLRVAEIQILSLDELKAGNQRLPLLTITATGYKISGGYAYYVQTQLFQYVYLSRQPLTKVHAVTWSANFTGITPNVNRVREVLRDEVDAFVNAFLAVNSK